MTIEERLARLEQRVFDDELKSNQALWDRTSRQKKYINNLRVEDEMLDARLLVLEGEEPPVEPPKDYPPTEDINDFDWGDFNPPTSTPAYLQEVVDEIRGYCSITRIADPDQSRFDINYAKHAVFNADDTIMKFPTSNGTAYINVDNLDDIKYQGTPWGGFWSNTESDILYGIYKDDVAFYRLHHSLDELYYLHDFSDTHTDIDLGYNEGNIDINDRFVCLIASKKSGGRELIILDIQDAIANPNKESNIWSRIDMPDGSLDWASISQSGDYIVLDWNNGQGMYVYDNTQGTPSNYRKFYDSTQHADLGIDDEGDDVWVAYQGDDIGSDGTYLVMVRLSDGKTRNLFEDTTGAKQGVWGGHISCRNTQRPGWAYLSESCCAGDSDGRMSNDVVAIKLSWEGNDMQYFFRAYNERVSGRDSSSFACPNRKGDMVAFRSYYYSQELRNQYTSSAPAWLGKVIKE